MEAVQGVAGDPAGIAAMAQHPGGGAVGRPLSQRLANGGGDHDPEPSAVELGTPGHPRHMSGDVQTPPEGVHHPVAL